MRAPAVAPAVIGMAEAGALGSLVGYVRRSASRSGLPNNGDEDIASHEKGKAPVEEAVWWIAGRSADIVKENIVGGEEVVGVRNAEFNVRAGSVLALIRGRQVQS